MTSMANLPTHAHATMAAVRYASANVLRKMMSDEPDDDLSKVKEIVGGILSNDDAHEVDMSIALQEIGDVLGVEVPDE